jgi:hypothetical protein
MRDVGIAGSMGKRRQSVVAAFSVKKGGGKKFKMMQLIINQAIMAQVSRWGKNCRINAPIFYPTRIMVAAEKRAKRSHLS